MELGEEMEPERRRDGRERGNHRGWQLSCPSLLPQISNLLFRFFRWLFDGWKEKEVVGVEELATNGEERSQAVGVLEADSAAKQGLLWWWPICGVGEEKGGEWWLKVDGAAKGEREGRPSVQRSWAPMAGVGVLIGKGV